MDNEIVACIQCGFCRAGCPTFGETTLESLNAKGRVTLAYNMLIGNIQPSADLAKRLYQCMLCLNCQGVCPAQVKVSAVVQAARGKTCEAKVFAGCIQTPRRSDVDAANPLLADPSKRCDSLPRWYKTRRY